MTRALIVIRTVNDFHSQREWFVAGSGRAGGAVVARAVRPLLELGCHQPLQDAQPQALLYLAVLRHAGQVGGLAGIVLQVELQLRPAFGVYHALPARMLPESSSA